MSKKQEIRERRRKQKKQKQMITLGLMIVGAGLIAAALIYPSTQLNNEFRSRYMADGNAMGNPDAPVTITEYSDYRCGHCGDFALETEPEFEAEFVETEKVYFVSRSVGMMLSSAPSVLATEASYCAGEQNKYWEMHDLIFANQTVVFTQSLLDKWAKTVGVDMGEYDACAKDNRYDDILAQDQADAEAEGISGTPSFVVSYVVDGEVVKQLLPGNYPLDAFRQAITDAYAAMGLEY